MAYCGPLGETFITLYPIGSYYPFLTVNNNVAARRSGSFNYADRHSLTGRPPVMPATGRLSPRATGGKGRFVIPGGPGLEERKSSK